MNKESPQKDQPASNFSHEYSALLKGLRDKIQLARVRAGLAVNREVTMLYWQVGRDILDRQKVDGWGAKVINQLAKDLRGSFPELTGFSARNLTYMRTFAEAYPDIEFVSEVPAQITWYHNCTLLDKVDDDTERIWYMSQTIRFGWSRAVLVHHIESGLYRRQGQALTNFPRTLLPTQSELAQQILKDPYNFEFLGLRDEASEHDLEHSLVRYLRKFLLELGVGFSFVGQQFHLEVGGQDFYIDLLFYHLKLRCYVVIELKAVAFQPEFAGKINFYLSAVDELLRHPDDKPSIGIVICKGKNKVVAEYSLRDMDKPIGVSSYQLTELLPESLLGILPSIEQLEAELEATYLESSEGATDRPDGEPQ
jgi:predicted nuclease of restriction endonuclease-like (RecB) superfamily